MANALAASQPGSLAPSVNGFTVSYQVTFVGDDVPNGQDATSADVTFDYDDTNETLRAKVRAAVEQAASGMNITVNNIQADVLITV